MAEQYDRYRPTYPDALIDDLVALQPRDALDVGCGTGKAAVLLARRGIPILGVEPLEPMAEVARSHGVPVEVAAFESWDDAGRQFDLIVSGQAWHWIDPELGVPKVARLLRPGGTMARFWNYHVLDEPVIAAFDAIYSELAPEAHGLGGDPAGNEDPPDPFADRDSFSSIEKKVYRWERVLSADEWVGLVATFSDHQRLGQERLSTLQSALHATIEGFGSIVHAHCGTYVRLARRG